MHTWGRLRTHPPTTRTHWGCLAQHVSRPGQPHTCRSNKVHARTNSQLSSGHYSLSSAQLSTPGGNYSSTGPSSKLSQQGVQQSASKLCRCMHVVSYLGEWLTVCVWGGGGYHVKRWHTETPIHTDKVSHHVTCDSTCSVRPVWEPKHVRTCHTH